MDTLFDHQNMSDDDLMTLIGALQDHQDTPNPNITALFQNANSQDGQSTAPAAADRPQTAILTPVPPPSARAGTVSPGAALADVASKASYSSLLGIPTSDQDQTFHFDSGTGNLVSGQEDDSVPNYQNQSTSSTESGAGHNLQGIQMRSIVAPANGPMNVLAAVGRGTQVRVSNAVPQGNSPLAATPASNPFASSNNQIGLPQLLPPFDVFPKTAEGSLSGQLGLPDYSNLQLQDPSRWFNTLAATVNPDISTRDSTGLNAGTAPTDTHRPVPTHNTTGANKNPNARDPWSYPNGYAKQNPSLTGSVGTFHYLNQTFADRLGAMMAEAKRQGIPLGMTDGFRPYEIQRKAWNDPKKRTKSGKHLAAIPGTSNHGWGTAADLSGGTAALNWAQKNASKFGLIFPMNDPNEDKYEPWHVELPGAPKRRSRRR